MKCIRGPLALVKGDEDLPRGLVERHDSHDRQRPDDQRVLRGVEVDVLVRTDAGFVTGWKIQACIHVVLMPVRNLTKVR